MVRQDLNELVKFAKEHNLRTTLSTNTILLTEKRAREILPYIDEIGVPIDGSSSEKSLKMRLGKLDQFKYAIESLSRIRRLAPHAEITIRTVISKVNKNDILDIGYLLDELKGKWDRWKLYQFTPINNGLVNKMEHYLSKKQFMTIATKVRTKFYQFYIKIYPSDARIGRYVFIGPEGKLYGVGSDEKYLYLGNVLKRTDKEIKDIVKLLINPVINSKHAC